MMTKGYEHPLHSLNLIAAGTRGDDDPCYVVTVAQGQLCVIRALRVRATKVNTTACEQAVARCLGLHAQDVAGFAVYGMDASWAESMGYWRERMLDAEARLQDLLLSARQRTARMQGLVAQGRELWGRLGLCAQFAGGRGMIVRGRAPRSQVQLLDALISAQARVIDQKEALDPHGFGPAAQEELSGVIAALTAEHRDEQQAEWRRRELSAELVVLRGALLGDVRRLVKVAPRVLGRQAAGAARMGRLLGQRSAAGGAPAQ